jgi:uncharacterized protein YcfJ
MPQDRIRTRGPGRASRPDAGRANIRSVPVFGIVKDNIDPNRAGGLKVYISDFGGIDPDDYTNWVSVKYMSGFFGRVNADSSSDDLGSYKGNPSSYGEWHAPPDIGTTVICIFVNGDMNYGFYIGAVPEPQTLQMVPAIGAEETIIPNASEASSFGGATVLPVTNMNTNNFSATYDSDFIKTPKPIHSYVAAIMAQQGIIRDPIRGPITSSAQREPASRVGWGVSSPGRPIYEGGYDDQTIESNLSANPQTLRVVARRGGHSIVLDDGDAFGNDNLIRIRTALGHQILMSDNGQTLMILHSNGQSYIELGKEGTVDIYSTNSINLRTQGDLNLHADNNVNIHAKKDMNFYAENMNFTTEKEMNQRVGSNYKGFTSGTHTEKVSGAMSFESSGESSFASSSDTYINGSKINLNSGKASTKPEEVEAIPIIAHTDTLFEEDKGFTAAPGKLNSITSRAPAHAPWSNAGQGVDVQTDLNSSSQLPSQPSSALGAATAAGIATGVTPVSAATASSIPNISAVSQSLDVNTTGAVLGSVAQSTANSTFRVVQQQGAAIVATSSGNVLAVGSFAQTPEQLEKAGVLKLGSHRLIDSLVQSGSNVAQCMPDTLFSGQTGAENLTNLTRNVTAQANVGVVNLQRTQTELTNAGVLTGKEAASEVAGVVLAGATTGVKNTVDAIKNTSSGETAGSSVPNETVRQIGLGAAAATVASVVTGVFSGLTQSLAALSTSTNQRSSAGVESSAFSAISQSFANMKPNTPQSLKTMNKESAEKTQLLSNQNSQSNTSAVSTILGGVLGGALGNQLGGGSGRAIATAVGAVAGAVLGSSLSRKPKKSAVPSEASGVSNLPGGEKILSMVKDGTDSAKNALPGTAALKGTIDSQVTDKMNNLSSSVSGKVGSLKNEVMSKLSVAEKAQLSSGLSAINSQGKKKIKLPTVATNTVDRSAINEKTKALLADPKIPAPDFSGEPNIRSSTNTSTASATRISQNDTRIEELKARLKVVNEEREKIKQEIQQLPNNSLPGDPKLAEIRSRLLKVLTEQQDILKQLG